MPVLAIAIGLEWYARSTRWAETENAYVKANVIAVSAEVSGRVAELAVRDQQRVERGMLLFAIDPAPYQLAVQRAEAQLGVTRTEIETLRAEYRTALRETEEAGARITCLSRQLERQRMLKEKGMTREELYDDARNNSTAPSGASRPLRRARAARWPRSTASPRPRPSSIRATGRGLPRWTRRSSISRARKSLRRSRTW